MATTNATGIKIERSKRINTPKGRLSYPHVFTPTSFQGQGDAKYSVSLLIPKSEKTFVAELKAAQEAATDALYPTKKPQNFEVWGLADGDDSTDPAAANCWILKASNKAKPRVVDAQGQDILDPLEVYGGAYGRLSINAKAYGTATKGGVSLELNVVQKVSDGEAFGGAAKAQSDAVSELGAYAE